MPSGNRPGPSTVGMRMSAFLAQLRQGGVIADRLVSGLGEDEFARDLFALEEIVDRLAPFARAGGGGELLVDLEHYQGEGGGGTPAFFRDHAMSLLNIATVVQRAREKFYALDDEESEDRARCGRADLRFARKAPIGYTADEVRKVQKVVKFLYSRRAYRKLKEGGIFRRAMNMPIWGEKQSIVALSRENLRALRRSLEGFTGEERELYDRLLALPFRLKHATSFAGRQGIVNVGMLWSLDSLMDWYVPGASGFTTGADIVQKMDTDFVFFRVEVGEGAMATRYGDVQFVFTMDQVLQDGWVTLHDMLAPIDSATLATLKLRYGGTPVRRSSYIDAEENRGKKWWRVRWKHEFLDADEKAIGERPVNILEEVFYGPDIVQGIVLSILRDLREVPLLQREAFGNMADPAYLAWLFKVLYRVEAKHPVSFSFATEDLLREHRKPAVDPRALSAATRRGRMQE